MAEIIVVPHTHWDREWYLPFERYRYRLVKLVDALLGILHRDEEYTHFLLDGQAIIAEDYLKIRGENEERLCEEVAGGRIGIGPWYTMPDEFLSSGEALIRNLMLGHRLGRKLGGPMKVGYLPDPFGHIAQMPQILRGFGIETAFLWRGADPAQTEFYWEAPDGSRVLTHWFAAGYSNAPHLMGEPEAIPTPLPGGLPALRDFLLSKASTDTILLMNGCDHMGPQANLTQTIKALNQKMDDMVVHGSLSDFASRVRGKGPPLATVKGELRSCRHAPILPGVLSSRIYLKQRNHRLQTLLEGYAEPIAALAWSLGEEYPAPFLRQAWRFLLQNHFHDSICGTSIDQVHREMLPRFDRAQQIAEEVVEDYLKRMGRQVALEREGIAILVFNPTPWERAERVCAWIEPMTCLPYGRGQGTDEKADLMTNPLPFEVIDSLDHSGERVRQRGFTLIDPEGEAVPFQTGKRRLFSEDILNMVKHLEKVRLSFRAKRVPPFGYRVYNLRPSGEESEPIAAADRDMPPSLVRDERALENEFYRVDMQDDGTLTVTNKESGEVYLSLGYFEDAGDAGDEYNYSPPDLQEVLDTRGEPAAIEVVEDEADWATIRVRHPFRLPEGLTPDRQGRSQNRVSCGIESFITLQRGVRRIDIRTVVENKVCDHRLRVAFPSGIRGDESIAESAFAVVRRPVRLPEGTGWIESPSPTHPQKRFVAVERDGQGFAVLNKGLPEYEVTEDGTIYLTLLRGVGWLSRDDLKTRRGHAGPPYETPEAQCLGKHIFEYAIVPYRGNWLQAHVWEEAARFNLPLVALRIEGGGKLPQAYAFLQVEPAELAVSAIKKAEEGEALIVRLYNIADERVEGCISLHQAVARGVETNLNEEERGALPVADSTRVCFRARGQEAKTLKLSLARGG